MPRFIGRTPLKEDELKALSLPGDVKERLQFKPLQPAKKRPVGENWKRFQALKKPLESNSMAATRGSTNLGMPKLTDPFDKVNEEEHVCSVDKLNEGGAIIDRDAMADRATETHNEHLYEEVVDKKTGKKSLLFRNAHFDRI